MSGVHDRASSAPESSGESGHPTVQSPEQQQFEQSSNSNGRKPHPTLASSESGGAGGQPTSRRDFLKMRRPSSPNATSAPITQASGAYTGGVVNRHPNSDAVHDELTTKEASASSTSTPPGQSSAESSASNDVIAFRVGVSEDRNQKCRRTMEDSHAFVYDFGGIKGQGYFAIFDGHAGKHAAEWCGANFHKYLLQQLKDGQNGHPIPDLLNATFHVVDSELSKLAAEDGTHSGCTAVTAFLRLEDENGNAVETDDDPDHTVGSNVVRGGAGHLQIAGGETEGYVSAQDQAQAIANETQNVSSGPSADAPAGMTNSREQNVGSPATPSEMEDDRKRKFGDGLHRERIKSLFGSGSGNSGSRDGDDTKNSTNVNQASHPQAQEAEGVKRPARAKNMARRTLYTANVGDARAVLSRGGKAVRLTYDHKGSDVQEAKRITDAGGFVMNNRVNGVLAVTRSLGDSSMKEFVVGSPYTTETTLGDEDDFLIVACDGLWDVCDDQTAVDLIRNVKDAQEASQILLDYALNNFSTDNLSILVVALQAEHAK